VTCVEAGIVKEPAPIARLRRWWSKASARERRAFLKEIGGGGA
jgi:hypothetical protein